jgi:hypothetical protein
MRNAESKTGFKVQRSEVQGFSNAEFGMRNQSIADLKAKFLIIEYIEDNSLC